MRISFVILSWFLCTLHTHAADVLELSNEHAKGISLSDNYLSVFEDSTGTRSINTIIANDSAATFNAATYNYNIRPTSTYWIKFTVRNAGDPFTQYVIENYYAHTKEFSIYYIENGKLFQQTTGEYVTYAHRNFQHKNLVLDLPVPDIGNERTYYIKIVSDLYVNFNFVINSQHSFAQYSTNEYLLLGIYYGIILLLILYNIILFFTIRAKLYILYIFYLLSGMLISLNEDKLGYQYLWPEHPELNPFLSFHVAPLLLVFCFILYASNFLELYKRAKHLFILVWASFAVYIGVFILNFYFPLLIAIRVITPLPFLIVFIATIVIYLKGYTSARFFILGSGLILSSIVLIQLRALAIIMGSIFTVYLFNYSLIIEAIILSIALSDRIGIIRKEKEVAQLSALKELEEKEQLQAEVNQQLFEKQQLQQKINVELEIKVTERTKELSSRSEELEIANIKLQSLIEQTNNMNIKLDLDNWELKKNVRHELVQRITGQEVSIDMFKTVFKDDITCFRFLDELKWNEGFVCTKCHYTKCKEADNSFVRKCSKCSHPESVTTNTLLHGIKFSITQALYMMYLIHARKGDVKLEVLADISGISIVSASKFRAKVVEKMMQLNKKHKTTTWEQIILND
jgi:two-component system, sensor histidine kinase LadS